MRFARYSIFVSSCKGCKKECPVNVDMATYKSEFLHHFYRTRLRPRDAFAMGFIGYVAPVASLAPQVANVFTQMPLLSNVVKFLGGIAQERPFPKFASEPFSKWYRSQPHASQAGREKSVVLYPDVFNDYFYPQTLMAAYKVLQAWGYKVLLPQGKVPAVRPLLHYGMLSLASRELKKAVRQLSPFVREGIPVIILEPSTLAVYRDELPELFPNSQDGKRASDLTMQLSEFIEQYKIELPKINKKAILHGHCHQKGSSQIW